ncbi:MAG: phospho-sugar mutase [Candidatus Borkfalkiaceae bacterium]|nr:phospho-sugar mutase [Christensenellaceae bacterium]
MIKYDAKGAKDMLNENVKRNYEEWLEKVSDEELKKELESLSGDEEAINERFYCELEFGTGGLRGKLRAGTNGMNVNTVSRAAAGLAEYLTETVKGEKSVSIAYDSRNKSREFAFLSAEIFSAKGIKAYIFDELAPTPVLSFAVRYLKTSAGVVVTASHNPKEYNGYKVYNEKGCQITEEAARAITEKIENASYFGKYRSNNTLIEVLDNRVMNAFLSEVEKLSLFDGTDSSAPKIVYTPLNGTGYKPVTEILKRIGVKDLTVVPEQAYPDGNFPTCPYPNPEEKAALKLAIELAEKTNADMVLATDPDADRVGIAVRKKDGGFRLFNGNETGAIMENFMLSVKSKNGSMPKNPVVVKTIVTSDMATDIAKKYGAEVKEVLTGFKYIGETIDSLENPEDYVFGMEESYGYLVGRHVRDKDSVSAAMIIVEAAAYYASTGKTLIDALEDLYAEFGYYKTALVSRVYPGEKGKTEMDALISALRENPLKEIAGIKINEFKDYSKGIEGLPKSNVLSFIGDGIKVIVRPSGTEPKVKYYLTAKRPTEKESDEVVELLKKHI